MAGLNDDVDEGLPALEEDVVDVNLQTNEIDIPTTNPSQPEPEAVTLITNDFADDVNFREPEISDLFGIGVIPGEIPNFNGEFEFIRRQRDNLVDFVNTTSNVQRKKSISQEDARILNAIIPGFVNDNRPLGFYTKDDSQTFLEESKVVMENMINNEETQINENLKNHINNLITHYNTLITLFNTGFKDKLNKQSLEIKNLLENVIIFNDDIFHKYFNDKMNFGDFVQTPINEINVDIISERTNVRQLLNELKNLYNDINLKSYLISFRYNSAGSLIFVNNRSEDLHDGFKLIEVFNIHKGDTQLDLPIKISLKLIDNEKELTRIRNKTLFYHRRENDTDLTDINNTEEMIITLTHEYNYLLKLTLSMMKFNDVILKLLLLFK